MKKFISALMIAGLLVAISTVASAEGKEKKEKKEREGKPAKEKVEQAPLQEMTLKGEVTKDEKPGKEGKPARISYLLVDGETKIRLPQAKAKKGKGEEQPAAYNLDDYVGMKVTIVGEGREQERKGKKSVTLVKITSIAKDGEEEM